MMMMMFTPERHLPTSGQHTGQPPAAHRRRHSRPATTADTGNTDSPTHTQRAHPTQTACAHPRRRAQAQGQALRHMDAGPSTKRSCCAYSTQG